MFPLRDMEILSRTHDYGMTASLVRASAIVTDGFIPYANDFDHKAVITLEQSMD